MLFGVDCPPGAAVHIGNLRFINVASLGTSGLYKSTRSPKLVNLNNTQSSDT